MFKVTGKKNGVKTTKTLTATVTVKPVTITADSEVTMSVGDSETLFTVKPSGKKLTTTSSNPEVATVDAYGNVVAVGVGTTTITASSKYTDPASEEVSIEVTVEAATVKITSLEATSSTTLEATLSAAASSDATVTVTKDGKAVDGTFSIVGTTATYTTTAKLTAGTYTMTLTDGDSTSSEDVTVEDEYVAEIAITSTKALTNPNAKTQAYIYYDVYNQYGESLRASTSLTWSTSASKITADKSTGKLTVTNEKEFTYNDSIYVIGVYSKTGVEGHATVTVGMSQALDTVEPVGFVSKNNSTKILEDLPEDFSTNTYYMIYKTYDQEGQEIDASASNIADNNVTFVISDGVLLVKLDTDDEKTYTIDGTTYSAVGVEPGQNVDKGGSFTVKAISNKTGTTNDYTFNVGEGALLYSLEITGVKDGGIVTDGETKVLSYVATDTTGATTTDYETIVRSTNTLSLTATEGTLAITEDANGEAVVTWSDDSKYSSWSDSAADGVDRTISLTTIVVGGSAEYTTLTVQDKRRPVQIKSIPDTAVVAEGTLTINFASDSVIYLDQYGDEMNGSTAAAFFTATATGDGIKIEQETAVYGVLVDFTDTNHFTNGDDAVLYSGNYSLTLNADKAEEVTNSAGNTQTVVSEDSVKFSIAKVTKTDVTDISKWGTVGAVKTLSLKVVPVDKLKDIKIKDVGLQEIVTDYSSSANGKEAGIDELTEAATKNGGGATFAATPTLTVVGTYEGSTLEIPSSYYGEADQTDVVVEDYTLTAVSGSTLTWADLYDSTTSGLTRKNATVSVSIPVYASTSHGEGDEVYSDVRTNITVSDAASKVTTVSIAYVPAGATKTAYGLNSAIINVYDQYGNLLTSGYDLSYTISNVVESETDLTHMEDSLYVSGNGTSSVSMTGVEIGDAFTITVTATGTDKSTASASVDLTVGADTYATISSVTTELDKALRTVLGYDKNR